MWAEQTGSIPVICSTVRGIGRRENAIMFEVIGISVTLQYIPPIMRQ